MAASCSLVKKTKLFAELRRDLVTECTAHIQSCAACVHQITSPQLSLRLLCGDHTEDITLYHFVSLCITLWTRGRQPLAENSLIKDLSAVKLFRALFSCICKHYCTDRSLLIPDRWPRHGSFLSNSLIQCKWILERFIGNVNSSRATGRYFY